MSLVPQNISSSVFSSVNQSSCTLTVPTSSVAAYRNVAVWRNFVPIKGGGLLLSTRANIPAWGNISANIPDGLHFNTFFVTITATLVSSSFFGWTSGGVSLSNSLTLSFVLTRDTVIIANFGKIDSIHLTIAGTLNSQPNITHITHLTITGNIDARDIKFMRDNMPYLTDLDLTGATIVTYTGTEGTRYGSSYTYPDNEMPMYSFYYTDVNIGKISLASIKLPARLISIGNGAFYECSGLTSITIPNSVTFIGNSAFYGCSNITEIYVKAIIPPSISSSTFYSVSTTIPIHVPCGSTAIYQRDTYWSNFTNITGDISVFNISVQSSNAVMGTANIVQANTCTNNTAIIQAVANANCHFLKWHDNDTNNPRTVAVTQDTSFTAIFEIMHSVTVSANNPVYGNVSGGNAYPKNSIALISATANTGYRFFKWQDGNTDNPRTITVTQDTSFTAVFASSTQGTCHVSVTTNNPSMGSVTGNSDYAINTAVTICAIANHGYRFVQWTDGNTQNPRTLTVTQATSFMAMFGIASQGMYHVSLTANNPSMGSVTGSGDYAANSIATIAAIVNPGYRFVHWTDGNTDNPRSIIVSSDTAFIADFAVSTVNMYHVTVSSANVNMGAVTGSGDYVANSTITIGAIANQDYRFMQWTDGNADNPRTITVTQDTSFTAVFAIATQGSCHVSVAANNPSMGSVTGNGDYAINTAVTIAAIANSGYRFVQWSDGNNQNPRMITLTQDTVFTAIFATATQGMYHVSVTTTNPSMGNVSGSGDYAANTIVTITATPNTGYRFVQWHDGNNQSSRTITLTQDTTFTATFIDATQNTYRITLLSNDHTKGTVMGSGDYPANTTTTIGAIANPGYRFIQWNDANTDNPRTITVTQDTAFVATFEPDNAIKEIEVSTISIYPNPATDNITVILPENISNAVFTLYDMQSKVLIRKEIGDQETVSVSNLAAGVYIYNVITEKQTYTGKLIINY
jgi:hypothetical protein